MPIAMALVEDTSRQANSLRGGLMVVNKLNFSTARFTIYHTGTGSYTNYDLFIKRTTYSTARKFGDECRGGPEDASLWAANVLTVNKKVGITFCQFCQCFINGSQH